MRDSNITKEVLVLMARLGQVQRDCRLRLESIEFLRGLAKKLVKEECDPRTYEGRREQIVRELASLKSKMRYEGRRVNNDDEEMTRILKRVNEFTCAEKLRDSIKTQRPRNN